MSRTPASYSMQVVRGATWEDEFTYTLQDKVTPVDLTGYRARMQVRSVDGQYGLTNAETLVLDLTTENGLLQIPEPTNGQVLIIVAAEDTMALNPQNLRKVKLFYSLELYVPEGMSPEYVIPLVQGSITVRGEVTR